MDEITAEELKGLFYDVYDDDEEIVDSNELSDLPWNWY